MSQFSYVAYDEHGAKVEGTIDAPSSSEATIQIQAQRLTVVEVTAVKSASSGSLRFGTKTKVTTKDLEFITSELAILIRSGVRIDKGLSILIRGASDVATKKLLQSLSDSIKGGKSVSESFAEHPEAFGPLFINMLQLGEASGNLAEVFTKLSDDLKFRRELQSKIIQSLTYPMVILFVCIGCILFVFNYIVPQMSGMFDRNDELPVYTEVLLGLSDWFINYQWFLALGLGVAGFAFYRSMENPSLRTKAHEFGLRLPLIGKGILLVERIRFNSSMAMGLSSGVSLIHALTLAQGNMKNQRLAGMLSSSISKVKQGGKLSDALSTIPIFSDFNVSILEVGEESGDLEPVFDEIAERAKQEFEGWTKTLTNMIEPILILFMGGIVGSVVVVMLLSIVSTNDVGL